MSLDTARYVALDNVLGEGGSETPPSKRTDPRTSFFLTEVLQARLAQCKTALGKVLTEVGKPRVRPGDKGRDKSPTRPFPLGSILSGKANGSEAVTLG